MKAVIFGSGGVALRLYMQLTEKYGEDYIEFFIDSMLEKESFCDKPVYSLQDLAKMDYNQYKYYFGTMSNQLGMKKELLKIGVDPKNFCEEMDYSEDKFTQTVKDFNSILIYPAPTDEIYEILEQDFRYYFSEYYDKIRIDYDMTRPITEYDLVLVWNKRHLNDGILLEHNKVFCIDETFYITIRGRLMAKMYWILYTNDKGFSYRDKSKKIFKSIGNNAYENGYIFASGPSLKDGLEKFLTMDRDNSLRAVCNSFISSKEYMNMIKPNAYFIMDSKFIGGFLRNITANICEYIKENDGYLFVPEHWVPLLVNKFGIEDKIIGLEMDADDIHFPTNDNLKVYAKAANVITTTAIPVISRFVKQIYITGCDGQDENDMPVWTHTEDLFDLDTVKLEGARHIIDLIDYIQRHNINYERVIKYGESLGVKYESLTPSYIPCLMERYKG